MTNKIMPIHWFTSWAGFGVLAGETTTLEGPLRCENTLATSTIEDDWDGLNEEQTH